MIIIDSVRRHIKGARPDPGHGINPWVLVATGVAFVVVIVVVKLLLM